jgi:GNAT superfamily N-acetyltransferase
MDDNALELHRVHDSTKPEFAELVRIYSEAHPRNERKNVESLSLMLARPEYLFHVVSHQNLVAGFAIVLCFTEADAGLLEYMAVDQNWRGHGIGQFLFTELVKLRELSRRYLLAEVDSDKAETADRIDRMRRKAFYHRLGCKEIEKLCYIMPQVSSAMPPAMDLLVYRQNLPLSIERSHLRKWLQSCYVQVYGKDENDPRIEMMLRNLPENLRLL